MSDELKLRVQHVLLAEVAPKLELDGSALEVLDATGGIIQLRLNGACAGCPATVLHLVQMIEQELRERIPEVDYLEAVP